MKYVKIIFPGWIKAPNGVAQFVLEMKKCKDEFMTYGVKLSIFSLDDATSIDKEFNDQKQIKERASSKNRLMKCAKYSHILTYIMIYLTMIRHSKKVIGAYKKQSIDEKVDLIHFQDLMTCYYYLKNNQNIHVPVYVTLHSNGSLWSMLEEYYPRFRSFLFIPMKKRIERTVLKKASIINFVADMPRKHFCNLYSFVDAQKTSFVYNGIPDIDDRKKKSHIDDVINLVCVGTLCNRKNQMGILKALSLLTELEQNKYFITFVGDGPDRNVLESFSSSLTVNVCFIGNSNRVNDYLLQADAFILFSKDEGLPISIIEAMRCGLPIISTNIAGIPEMIENGISGYLVDVDVDKLSKLFKKLLAEKPNWNRMGMMSRKLYEKKFSREAMVSSYVDLWNLNSNMCLNYKCIKKAHQ